MSYRNLPLKTRRRIARLKRTGKAQKTFNLKWVNDTIDQVITELSEYSDREPEIAAALESMLATKRLVQAYSQRMFDTPYRSGRRRYDKYRDNHRFDDASDIFESQRDRD